MVRAPIYFLSLKRWTMGFFSSFKGLFAPKGPAPTEHEFNDPSSEYLKRCERYWLNDWIEEPPPENKRKALLTAAFWLNEPPGHRLEQMDIFCDIVRGVFIPHNHSRDEHLLSLILGVINSGEPLGQHLAPLLDEYVKSVRIPDTPQGAASFHEMLRMLEEPRNRILELDAHHKGSELKNEMLDLVFKHADDRARRE
jgi:hypothetical protein